MTNLAQDLITGGLLLDKFLIDNRDHFKSDPIEKTLAELEAKVLRLFLEEVKWIDISDELQLAVDELVKVTDS